MVKDARRGFGNNLKILRLADLTLNKFYKIIKGFLGGSLRSPSENQSFRWF